MDDVGWLALGFFILFLHLTFWVTVGKEALSSLSPARSRELAEQAKPGSSSLAWLQQRPVQVCSALSIVRAVSIIVAVALGMAMAMDISLNWGAALVSIAILLLCFAIIRVISGALARNTTESIILSLARPLKVLTVLCWPVVGKAEAETTTEADEVLDMEEAISLEPEHQEMIRGIFDLQETTAREIMVPRVDIVAAERNAPVDELIDLMVKAGYSRIPVYHDGIDNIVGIVSAKDLLNLLKEGKKPSSTAQIIRPAYFIPESKKVDDLLREFKEKRMPLAIVVDEYGGTAGLVTIKDVLEEIVGEIDDEYDRSQPQMERLSPTEAVLDAKVSIYSLNEEFKVDIRAEGFDTVGGLMLHQLGKIASPGDEIQIDGLRLAVLSTLGRRIQKIKVTKLVIPQSTLEE